MACLGVQLFSSTIGLGQENLALVHLKDSPCNRVVSAEIHRFGGQEIALTLVVETASLEKVGLQASLSQFTFSLAAKHQSPPRISESREGYRGDERELTLQLPAVARETDFQLRFQAKVASQAEWSPAGTIRIRVYPRDLLAPLKKWARRVQLRLDDRQGVLTQWLADGDVAFVDSRSALEKRAGIPTVTMIVTNGGNVLLPGLGRDLGHTIIVFTEQIGNLPKVVSIPQGSGRLIKVDLPIIQDLADDPRRQKQFLEIIGLANAAL